MRIRLVFRQSRVRSSSRAKHYFVAIGHEIVSTAILSLLLIQEEQLLAKGCALVNHLGLSLPRRSVVRLTDHLDMTVVVDWDVKGV